MLELARAAPDGRVPVSKLYEGKAFRSVMRLAGGRGGLAGDFASHGLKYRYIDGSGWLILRGEGSRPGEVHPCTRLFSPQCV